MPSIPLDMKKILCLDSSQLKQYGFIDSGLRNVESTVTEYSERLLNMAIQFGEIDKAKDMPAEITHEHVRQAALTIARSFGRPSKNRWLIVTQIGEYVATAVAGIGAGHLTTPPGIIALALGTSAAVLLIVTRLTKSTGE